MHPEEGGDLGGVDPVSAGGQDEQWLAVGGEDQRVGDGGHGAVELGCGGCCRRRVLGEDDRLTGRSSGGQGVPDPTDGRVLEDVVGHGPKASDRPVEQGLTSCRGGGLVSRGVRTPVRTPAG